MMHHSGNELVGLLGWGIGRLESLYLHKTTHKKPKHICMTRMGFETKIPVLKQSKVMHLRPGGHVIWPLESQYELIYNIRK